MKNKDGIRCLLLRFKKEFLLLAFILACTGILTTEVFNVLKPDKKDEKHDFSVVITGMGQAANKESVNKLIDLYDEDIFGYFIDSRKVDINPDVKGDELFPLVLFGNHKDYLGQDLEDNFVYLDKKIAGISLDGKYYKAKKVPDQVFSKLGLERLGVANFVVFLGDKNNIGHFFDDGSISEVGNLLYNTKILNEDKKTEIIGQIRAALKDSAWDIYLRDEMEVNFMKSFLLPYTLISGLAVVLALRLIFINKIGLIKREFAVKFTVGKGLDDFNLAIIIFFILSYIASVLLILLLSRSFSYLKVYSLSYIAIVVLISCFGLLFSLRGERLVSLEDKA